MLGLQLPIVTNHRVSYLYWSHTFSIIHWRLFCRSWYI